MENHPYASNLGFAIQLNYSLEKISIEGFKNGGIWFSNTKVLVCGTFPPKNEYFNRKGYIHYSSVRNKFWQHIDSIYEQNLYANSNQILNDNLRIENCELKISFLKKKLIGLVDIYTKISRKAELSSKDDDIIAPFETIFETSIFSEILNSKVENIVFVYSKSYNVFIDEIKKQFPDAKFDLVRPYMKDNISLRVEKININNKTIFLSYTPIHGKLSDSTRRPALFKALNCDYN